MQQEENTAQVVEEEDCKEAAIADDACARKNAVGLELTRESLEKPKAHPGADEPICDAHPTAEPLACGQVANFHSSSRLHFLGTWRERVEQWRETWRQADGNGKSIMLDPGVHGHLKEYVKDVSASAADAGLHWAHLDMDCFFASIVQRDAGHPPEVPMAVVTSLSPGGELCSCNYAARTHGVNTHLWSVERARGVLPSIKLVPMSEGLLRSAEVAFHQVYNLMVVACHGDTERVHVRSCDEAFIELRDEDVHAWADALCQAVHAQTQCSCSIGVGSSQVLAKLACKACKPNAVRVINADQIQTFMAQVPLATLPQVGRSLAAKLDERQLVHCKDIWALPKRDLQQWFGVKGELLWAWSRGEDAGDVLRPAERKTMSSDINFGVRPRDKQDCLKLIREVSRQLSDRLSASALVASQITLKLKIAVLGWTEPMKKGGHGVCDDMSRSGALTTCTSDANAMSDQASRLLDALAPDPKRVRGVGLAAKVAPAKKSSSGTLHKFLRPSGTGAGSERAQADASTSCQAGSRFQKADRSRSPRSSKDPFVEQAALIPEAAIDPEVRQTKQASELIIDCDSSGDERPHNDAKVPCPVCGSLHEAGSIQAHVNGHFDS